MSKDPDGFNWMLSGMNEHGELLLCMNSISTSYSELLGPLANLAIAREKRGIDTSLVTIDNVSKDGPSLLSGLSLTSLPTFKFAGVVLQVYDDPSSSYGGTPKV